MNRREILSTLPIALSGCISAPSRPSRDGGDGYVIDVIDRPDPEAYSIEFAVSYPDEERVVADLQIAVTANADETVGISTDPPRPFGILAGKEVDGAGSLAFWSADYETSDLVGTEGHSLTQMTQPGLITRLQPGESVRSTYSVRRDAELGSVTTNLLPGIYEVVGVGSDLFEVNGTSPDVTLQISES